MSSFTSEDAFLLSRLRDQEAMLSSRSEEIKKILSSIPESKYITIPRTAINEYNNSNNDMTSNNVNMTPYNISYVDRISNHSRGNTVNLSRNTISVSKNNNYNTNIIDILTIRQRLEDNIYYDTQKENDNDDDNENRITSYVDHIRNKKARVFLYKLYDKMFRRKYAERHYYKNYGKFFLSILYHAINENNSKKRKSNRIKAKDYYYNNVMNKSMRKWHKNTNDRMLQKISERKDLFRRILLIKAKEFIDKVKRLASRKKSVGIVASSRKSLNIMKQTSSSSSLASLVLENVELPPPSDFAELFQGIKALPQSPPSRLFNSIVSSNSSASSPSPPKGLTSRTFSGKILSRIISNATVSTMSSIKDFSKYGDTHYRHRKNRNCIARWNNYMKFRKCTANSVVYADNYRSKRLLVISIAKMRNFAINSIIDVKINDKLTKFKKVVNYKNENNKTTTMIARKTTTFRQLIKFISLLRNFSRRKLKLRFKLVKVLRLTLHQSLSRWISFTERINSGTRQCSNSDSYYLMMLCRRFLRRWAERLRSNSNRNLIIKVNKSKSKRKNGRRTERNVLSLARRRTFLSRWYDYIYQYCLYRDRGLKLARRLYSKNAQRVYFQRLYERKERTNKVTSTVRKYHKYDRAMLLLSQYLRKFKKYISVKVNKSNKNHLKINKMKYYYYSIGLSSLESNINRRKSGYVACTNGNYMKTTNVNKMKKYLAIWKKKMKRLHKSQTKVAKVKTKRRLLLCPKYVHMWISHLSTKLQKRRLYSKKVKKFILRKCWDTFYSIIVNDIKISKNVMMNSSKAYSYILSKGLMSGIRRLSEYHLIKSAYRNSKSKSQILYRKLLLLRIIKMWKEYHHHATDYLRKAARESIKFKLSRLFKRIRKKISRRRLLVSTRKIHSKSICKKFLSFFSRFVYERSMVMNSSIKYGARYRRRLVLSSSIDLWFHHVQVRRKEKIFERTHSHKHNRIISIGTKNIRKYSFKRAMAALFDSVCNSSANNSSNFKADKNAYLMSIQRSFNTLFDYCNDNSYRNYFHYDSYFHQRNLKLSCRHWMFYARIKKYSKQLPPKLRSLVVSCIKLKKHNDSNKRKILKLNKLKLKSTNNSTNEKLYQDMYLQDAATIGPNILDLEHGELAATNEKQKVSGQVYSLQLALTWNYWRIVKSLLEQWAEQYHYHHYLVDRLYYFDRKKLSATLAHFTKWVDRRKGYRKKYHKRAIKGHITCQMRATIRFWRRLTRFIVGTRTLKLKRKIHWFRDTWLSKFRTRVRVKKVIEDLLNDEVRLSIYFREWLKDTDVETKLVGYKEERNEVLKNRFLTTLKFKVKTEKDHIIKVRRNRGNKAARLMKAFFQLILFHMAINIKNETVEASASKHYKNYLKRNVLYNLLFFRRNRIAHDYLVKKKSKQFLQLLRVNAKSVSYDKSLMSIGNIALMTKMFQRLVLHTLYGSNGDNIHKTKRLNGKKYNYKAEMVAIVDEWRDEFFCNKVFAAFRRYHRDNVNALKIQELCDYHYYKFQLRSFFKKLIKAVSKRRKNNNVLKHVEDIMVFKLLKNAFQKLDYNACVRGFANDERYRLVEMYFKSTCMKRGVKALCRS